MAKTNYLILVLIVVLVGCNSEEPKTKIDYSKYYSDTTSNVKKDTIIIDAGGGFYVKGGDRDSIVWIMPSFVKDSSYGFITMGHHLSQKHIIGLKNIAKFFFREQVFVIIQGRDTFRFYRFPDTLRLTQKPSYL